MEEAKVEERLFDNWVKMIGQLVELRKTWEEHSALVHSMNMDSVHPRLGRHLAHGFNRADFYLGVPDLIDYGRQEGGIEYLQIEKEKTTDGRREARETRETRSIPRR